VHVRVDGAGQDPLAARVDDLSRGRMGGTGGSERGDGRGSRAETRSPIRLAAADLASLAASSLTLAASRLRMTWTSR
jgi:hypothetical protein